MTALKSSVDKEFLFSKKKNHRKKGTKNKSHCLLADPAKSDIPKTDFGK